MPRIAITLITSSVRRPAPDCLDPKIHHNNLLPSILAKVEANAAGADDAVVLDHRGFIAETNATHIFMVFTPDALDPAGSRSTPRSWRPRRPRPARLHRPGDEAADRAVRVPDRVLRHRRGVARPPVLTLSECSGTK